MAKAYAMARVAARDVNVAEAHDCFTVMGAIAVEVLAKAEPSTTLSVSQGMSPLETGEHVQ
jgi:hypothetical protein